MDQQYAKRGRWWLHVWIYFNVSFALYGLETAVMGKEECMCEHCVVAFFITFDNLLHAKRAYVAMNTLLQDSVVT